MLSSAQFSIVYDEDLYDSEIDYVMTLIDSFLNGLKANTFADTATDCSSDIRSTIADVNYTYYYWIERGLHEESVFNTTRLISGNFASMVSTCYITGYQLYVWEENKRALFKSDTDILTAFL